MEVTTQETAQYCADWLCASDVDGTLQTGLLGYMPRVNRVAIERFRALGGKFTIASGRSPASVGKVMTRLKLEDTPAVVLNGGGVYDCAKKQFLRFTPIPDAGVDWAMETLNYFPRIQFQMYLEQEIHIYNPGWHSMTVAKHGYTPFFAHKNFKDVPKEGWGKAIFFGHKKDVLALKQYCYSLVDAPVHFMESSNYSFEILAPNTHKGTALLQLAEILGIDPKNTAAIGNYDNDTGMIQTAALTASTRNAPRSFRAKAEHVVRRDRKGAVAEFLGIIERRALEGRQEAVLSSEGSL
ncbi:MAG: HAD family hydrolase [Oscillospiraceae bacterium]|nr:HAD family hydrolase [Oscillospiraceae bacterium]